MKYLVLLLILFSTTISCERDNTSDESDITIGAYYGFCGGNCTEFYQYRDGKIYADNFEKFPDDPVSFENMPLDADDFIEEFDGLINEFPSFLIDSSEMRYGCPDCGDWGAIYVAFEDRTWALDNLNNNNPREIQNFVSKIQELIDELP